MTKPRTWAELAKALNVAPSALTKWKKEGGPKQLDVDQWKAWLAQKTDKRKAVRSPELAELLLEEKKESVRLKRKQADLHEEKLKIMRGQYIDRDEIEKQLAPLVAEFQTLIEDRDNEIAGWGSNRTSAELRSRLTSTRNEVFAKIRDGQQQLITTSQKSTSQKIIDEPTQVHLPKSGRPTEPNSRRSQRAKRQAKKDEQT